MCADAGQTLEGKALRRAARSCPCNGWLGLGGDPGKFLHQSFVYPVTACLDHSVAEGLTLTQKRVTVTSLVWPNRWQRPTACEGQPGT